MRPVNLLPQSARPYVASGKAGNGSYVLIGVLAALVLGVAGYVLTTNSISSHKSEIAQAQQETAAAQAKASSLQKYGDFNQVAATRLQSVSSLAVSRIDYERLLRETSRVLPGGVWVTSLDAEAVGGGTTGGVRRTTLCRPGTRKAGEEISSRDDFTLGVPHTNTSRLSSSQGTQAARVFAASEAGSLEPGLGEAGGV